MTRALRRVIRYRGLRERESHLGVVLKGIRPGRTQPQPGHDRILPGRRNPRRGEVQAPGDVPGGLLITHRRELATEIDAILESCNRCDLAVGTVLDGEPFLTVPVGDLLRGLPSGFGDLSGIQQVIVGQEGQNPLLCTSRAATTMGSPEAYS